MIKEIKVIPNSKKSGIGSENPLIVRVKEKAEKNKANIAVIKLLKKHFNSGVRILKGLNSRKKLVEID